MKQTTSISLSLSPEEVAALRYVLYAGLGTIDSKEDSVMMSKEAVHEAFHLLMDQLNSEPEEVVEPEVIN